MRITNRMMTNNMLYNINNNKNMMNTLQERYSTGLAIQRPSDDPIVAVRALKLRTNLSELNQYYEKNIPDAKSWMETTESALRITSEIITKIHTYCVQGANDTLTEEDRDSIAANLNELRQQIYQEGNANYAGRYLFSGYKTGTGLVFDNATRDLEYRISETIKSDGIEISKRIVDSCDISGFDIDDPTSFDTSVRPSENTVYRLRLAYDNLKRVEDGGAISLKIPEVDENGNYVYDIDADGNNILQFEEEYDESDMNIFDSDDPLAYKPEPDEINYIEDTGEIILGEELYNKWRNSDFVISYEKNSFEKNDLRPEHYFDCEKLDLTIQDDTEREEQKVVFHTEDQKISYEVNFNQKIAINVQGRDAFRHSLGRMIDDIVKAVSDVQAVKYKMEDIDRALKDTALSDEQKSKLNEIKSVLQTEFDLKDGILHQVYERGIGAMEDEENTVNAATADIGTRYNRIELTENRLSTQQTEFTDLLSQNEDADLVDTIVNYNAMETIYNASLSSASKVVKNTLLDFL